MRAKVDTLKDRHRYSDRMGTIAPLIPPQGTKTRIEAERKTSKPSKT